MRFPDSRPPQHVAQWLRHTPMTEPGALAAEFETLPSDVASLNRIAQGLLVHSEWLSAYGLDARTFGPVSRATLPVSERLGGLLKLDRLSLRAARAPANRSAGTCRDFALTLSSFLRAKGAPARLRCGFAGYLTDGWEDHWVCEYWDGQKEEWRLSDPQLDEITRARCAVNFDPVRYAARCLLDRRRSVVAVSSRGRGPGSFRTRRREGALVHRGERRS